MKLITVINKCKQAKMLFWTHNTKMYKGLCCCDMFYKSAAHLGEGFGEPPYFRVNKMQKREKPAGQLITWNLNMMMMIHY